MASMKRRKSEVVSLLRGRKMTLRVNSQAKILVSAKTKMMMMRETTKMVNVVVDKSVDADADVEKPSFPIGAYDT